MNRLLLPLAALLVCGLLSASASAMPVDANHARSVAAGRYYSSYGDPNPAARPASEPVSSNGGGSGSTPWILAGASLLVIATGVAAVRVRPRPVRARVRTP